MGEDCNQKINLKILLITFFLSCLIMFLTTPIHEAAHWIMSDIDPYIEPVEFHLFENKPFNNENILSSPLGFIVVREKYKGAFQERSMLLDFIQELICIFIQIILTVIIVSKSIKFLLTKD
ncbi:MAG: hypothetical protein JSU91_05330 [Thermoplasmatales archaeon]|nr:MAG: hypothetical protein JSU91_05330 [Thermoplasmatales archaeon]